MSERIGTAVISGAGSGIGAAVATALARRGYALALLGRRHEPLEATLSATGAQGSAFAVDVRDADAVAGVVRAAEERFGPVAAAIPAAGVARVAPFVELEPAALRETIETNLLGSAHLFHAVLPGMLERGRGHLFPLLSVAARSAFPGWSAYCASKWGLLGLVETLREETQGSGVRISAITPGATESPLWNDVPGEWDRRAMLPAAQVARAILWALESGPDVAVEEIRLQPPGGNL